MKKQKMAMCNEEYRREYRETHKEQIRKSNAKWKREHKEERSAYNKIFYQKEKKEKNLTKLFLEIDNEMDSWSSRGLMV